MVSGLKEEKSFGVDGDEWRRGLAVMYWVLSESSWSLKSRKLFRWMAWGLGVLPKYWVSFCDFLTSSAREGGTAVLRRWSKVGLGVVGIGGFVGESSCMNESADGDSIGEEGEGDA